MELVDLVESAHLSLLFAHYVPLLLLNIVDCGLNLRSQILFQHLQVVAFLFIGGPSERLFFLLPHIDFLFG